MSIRVRVIDGHTVALCAAVTKAEVGDLYLDDNVHHALSSKFARDFNSQGLDNPQPVEPILAKLMEQLEETE